MRMLLEHRNFPREVNKCTFLLCSYVKAEKHLGIYCVFISGCGRQMCLKKPVMIMASSSDPRLSQPGITAVSQAKQMDQWAGTGSQLLIYQAREREGRKKGISPTSCCFDWLWNVHLVVTCKGKLIPLNSVTQRSQNHNVSSWERFRQFTQRVRTEKLLSPSCLHKYSKTSLSPYTWGKQHF